MNRLVSLLQLQFGNFAIQPCLFPLQAQLLVALAFAAAEQDDPGQHAIATITDAMAAAVDLGISLDQQLTLFMQPAA